MGNATCRPNILNAFLVDLDLVVVCINNSIRSHGSEEKFRGSYISRLTCNRGFNGGLSSFMNFPCLKDVTGCMQLFQFLLYRFCAALVRLSRGRSTKAILAGERFSIFLDSWFC